MSPIDGTPVLDEFNDDDFLLKLSSPISGKLTSGFYAPRGDRLHYGGDIGGPAGSVFTAPIKLTVTDVRDQMSNSPGGMVWAVDDDGRYHKFHHVAPGVKVGDVVEVGGQLGTLSDIKEPHLDYKIHDPRSEKYIDWTKHYAGWEKKRGDTSALMAGPGAVAPVDGTPVMTQEKQATISNIIDGMPVDGTPVVSQETNPRKRAYQEGMALMESDPLGTAVRSIINAPSKYITQPLTNSLIDKPLEARGVPSEIDVPVESIQGEGLTFPLSGDTIKAPVRGLATTAAQALVDWKLYNKLIQWAGSGLGKLVKPESGVMPIEVQKRFVTRGYQPFGEPGPFKQYTPSTELEAALAEIDKLRLVKGAEKDLGLFRSGYSGGQGAKLPLYLRGETKGPLVKPVSDYTSAPGELSYELKYLQDKVLGLTPEESLIRLSGGGYRPKETTGIEGLPIGSRPVVSKSAEESAQVFNAQEAALQAQREAQRASSNAALQSQEAINNAMLQSPQGYSQLKQQLGKEESVSQALRGETPRLSLDVPMPGQPAVTLREPLIKGERLKDISGTLKNLSDDNRKLFTKYYGGGPETEDLLKMLKTPASKRGTPAAIALSELQKIKDYKAMEATPNSITALNNSLLAETPVITKTFKTKFDSTLGPKGTEVSTIPLTDRDVAVRDAFTGKDISQPIFAKQKWDMTLKTNERLASEINDAFPGFMERFFWPMKAAENTAHNNTVKLFAEMDELRKSLPSGSGDRIGINLIAQRGNGLQRLEAMGVKVPQLTPEEQAVEKVIRAKFEELLNGLNQGRALAGKQPIWKDPDYFPFMIKFTEEVTSGRNPILSQASVFKAPTETPFKYKLPLSNKPYGVATDVFDVFKNYATVAERHTQISPQLERLNKFQNGFDTPLSKVAPNTNDALNNMRVAISGAHEPFNLAERMLIKASNNLVVSMLWGYPRSVVNQMGALAFGAGETGVPNMIKGLTKMLESGSWDEARRRSIVLSQRTMEVAFQDLWGGKLGKAHGKLKHYGLLPLEKTDDFFATSIWWSAEMKARQMGLTGKAVDRFADLVVLRTAASASPIDRAMLQNSPLGRAATSLGTFTIAEANYLSRHIFGRGNVNFKGKDGFKKLVDITLTGIGLNYLQRHLMGMEPGMPEPITKATEAIDAGAGPVEAGWEAAKEFGPYIPLVGNMVYGSGPGGPLASTLTQMAMGYKHPAEVAAQLGAVPNIALRGLKTQEGRDFLGDFRAGLGLDYKDYKTDPLEWSEVFLGKEPKKPEEQKAKEWDIDTWMQRNLK